MLFRSGKNWVFDFFASRGWLVKQRRLRRRVNNRQFRTPVAAESLEDRTLLSTITVTSLADSLNAGNGVTLRDAIQAANTDTSVDGSVAGEAGVQNEIVFQTGLTGTIALDAGLGQMVVSSSMTITGLGATNTIIDAQHNSRIFDITADAVNVTIESISLDNGMTTDNGYHSASNPGGGEGGAIRSAATGILTVNNSIISGNATTGVNAYGGAIYSNGQMSITGTSLSGNSTAGDYAHGGAIFSDAALTVTNCNLTDDSTTGTQAYGGAIKGYAAITITNSTLSGNFTSGSGTLGGAIESYAALTMMSCTLTGNSAVRAGGAVRCNGPLAVTNSTFYENSTAGYGGAIAAIDSTTITNCTIVQNHSTAGIAGGVYHDLNNGTGITLCNTIVAQNTDDGTAPDTNLSPVTGSVTVQNCLIGDNTGTSFAAAPVSSPDANGNLIGTSGAPIDPLLGPLADNGGPTLTMASLGGSPVYHRGSLALAVDPNTGQTLLNDQRGILFNRSVFNAVDMGAYQTQGFVTLEVTSTDDQLDTVYNSAHETLRDSIYLANTLPGAHYIDFDNPGFLQTQFAITLGGTPLELTNTSGTIRIVQGTLFPVIISGNNTSPVFQIDSGVTAEIDTLTITDGKNDGFGGGLVNNGTLTLNGDIISNNSAASGGGLFNSSSGSVTLVGTTLTNNSALGGEGGGLFNEGSAVLKNSTVANNSATTVGGGVSNAGGPPSASLTVSGSSILNNSAGASGGGIANNGSLNFTNSTASGNSAATTGGGLYDLGASPTGGQVIATDGTIAGNFAPNGAGVEFDPDSTNGFIKLFGTILATNSQDSPGSRLGDWSGLPADPSSSNNLVGDGTNSGLTNGLNDNIVGSPSALADPLLGPVENHGGATPTMALLPGSPAIDAGGNFVDPSSGQTIVADQRGFTRPMGAAADIGAFESTLPIVVNSTSDTPDYASTVTVGQLGNAANTLAGNTAITLRDAIDAVNNTTTQAYTIEFDPTVFPAGRLTTITLGGKMLELSNTVAPITIQGPGAGQIAISGGNLTTVFQVDESVTAEIDGVTITGGSGTNGGGIFNTGALSLSDDIISGNTAHIGGGFENGEFGTVTLTACTVSNNSATGTDNTFHFSGDGGGFFTYVGTVTVIDSTISNNTAANGVGGGFIDQGTIVVVNSTLAGNSAQYGGGFYDFGAYGGALTIINSTIADNSAVSGGGGYYDGISQTSFVKMYNSIMADNSSSSDPTTDDWAGFGFDPASSHDILGVGNGNSMTAGQNGNMVGASGSPVNPLLAPLGDYGGPTQTLALLPGSPAIDAGSDALAVDPAAANAPLTTDQRGTGFARLVGTVDIGAYEVQVLTDTTPLTTLSAVAGDSTGNVVLATFQDEIAPAGLLSYISVPGASATNVTSVSGNNVGGNYTSPAIHGFLYNGTTYTTLDPSGSIATNVTGVSGSIVVGYYLDAGDVYHGFLYDSLTSSYTTLDPPGSIHTGARAVSGNIVAGDFYDASQVQQGFVYNILTSTYTTFAVPGATASSTSIVAVSGGNVVGSYVDAAGGAIHGFLYNTLTSTSTTLDPPGSIATNATGVSGNTVVGYYLDAGDVYHGFVYDIPTSTYTTLDPPGSIYTGIVGISGNNIAGDYQDASQVQRGFVYNSLTSTYTTFAVPGTSSTYVWGGISGGNVVGFYLDASGNRQGFLYQMAPVQSDFTPTVNWGGTLVGTPTVSVQLVSQSATGSTWEVEGNAIYANAGTFTPTVTVTDATGSSVQTTNTQFNVQPSNTNPSAAFSFAGEYAVATTGSNTLTLASIAQSGSQLSLSGSTTATATVVDTPGQLLAGGAVVATYQNSVITFSSGVYAGQTWTKLDLPTDYTNPAGSRVHITQNGSGLMFSDRNGTQSAGTWTSPTTISAYGETVTIGSGRFTGQLLWQDGTIWSEVVNITGTENGAGTTNIQAVPSNVLVTDYLTPNGTTVYTVQTGTINIVFIDRIGHMVLGTYSPYDPSTNTPQATAPDYPGYTAAIGRNTITWTDGIPADTTVWTATSSASSTITITDYTNQNGVPVHAIENGTNQFVIVDGLGNTSLGHFLTANTGVADSYPSDVATFSANQVTWSDGTFVWTTTNNPPLLITFTDANTAITHVKLLTSTTLVGLDGSLKGIQGTRLNGKIFWSNGQIWDNLDFDALNAFFEMETGYP